MPDPSLEAFLQRRPAPGQQPAEDNYDVYRRALTAPINCADCHPRPRDNEFRLSDFNGSTANRFLPEILLVNRPAEVPAGPPPPWERNFPAVEATFRRLFNAADSDRNGWITWDEARASLANRALTGNDACVAAAMVAYFDDIKRLSGDQLIRETQISGQDLNQLLRLWRTSIEGGAMSDSERQLIDGMRNRITRTREMLANSSMNLFANEADPMSSLRPEGMVQGQVGNCNFVAAAAGLASHTPTSLFSMFTNHGDGTCTVNFHDPSGNGERVPIRVELPTQAELAYHETGSAHGTYGMVLQMAYGRYLDRSAARGLEMDAGDGWAIHRGLRMLTGEDYGFSSCRLMSDSALYSILNQHLSRHRPVNAILTAIGDSDDATGLPAWHHYSVLRVEEDPAHPGDYNYANVVLRNPHGSSGLNGTVPADVHDLGNGHIRMSYTRFAARFNFIVHR